MLLFLFSCVMPMLDTSGDILVEDDENYSLEVGKVDRSLRSSVKLVIKYDAVDAGHASGNYFKYGKQKFIKRPRAPCPIVTPKTSTALITT